MFGNEDNYLWETKKLENIGVCKNGMNFSYKKGGFKINCLGVGDFKENDIIKDTYSLPIIELTKKPDDEYLLKNDDIVFVRSNGNRLLVGRSVLVYPNSNPTVFSGFCIRFRKNTDLVNSDFLLHFFKTDDIRIKMRGRGANIQNLNQKILNSLLIPIPPKSLQDEFSEFIKLIDKSKFVCYSKYFL